TTQTEQGAVVHLRQDGTTTGPQRCQHPPRRLTSICELGQQFEDTRNDYLLAAFAIVVEPLEDPVLARLVQGRAEQDEGPQQSAIGSFDHRTKRSVRASVHNRHSFGRRGGPGGAPWGCPHDTPRTGRTFPGGCAPKRRGSRPRAVLRFAASSA